MGYLINQFDSGAYGLQVINKDGKCITAIVGSFSAMDGHNLSTHKPPKR